MFKYVECKYSEGDVEANMCGSSSRRLLLHTLDSASHLSQLKTNPHSSSLFLFERKKLPHPNFSEHIYFMPFLNNSNMKIE